MDTLGILADEALQFSKNLRFEQIATASVAMRL